jgi:hypothetical protein
MKGEFSQNDETTAPLGPLFIISNMPLMNQAPDGKVGGMGRKADPIRNFYFPKFNGRKERWKRSIHN